MQGCQPEQAADKSQPLTYAYLNYDIDCCTDLRLTEEAVQYTPTVTDSIYTLRYIFSTDSISADTITYILKADAVFKPQYLVNGERQEHKFFTFVSTQDFTIDRKYTVFKFASKPFAIDGCVTHFWAPEFGIILTRSATWKSFRKLKTNNDSLNKKIHLLTELIYQDTKFYKGCTDAMELVRQKDFEEFHAWKSGNLSK
jgi:hypothetical protein